MKPLLGLLLLATATFADGRSKPVSGVDEISAPGVPGPLCVYGSDAFVVASGGLGGKLEAPVPPDDRPRLSSASVPPLAVFLRRGCKSGCNTLQQSAVGLGGAVVGCADAGDSDPYLRCTTTTVRKPVPAQADALAP